MQIDSREYKALLRQDFAAFTQRSFLELNSQTPFLNNWHLELIAAKLEQCRSGQIRRLIINIPPRNLKSICASVAFPAWLLGHDPAKRIIAVSYGQDLASALAMQCRTVMASSWYQDLFPGTRLVRPKMAVDEFATTAHGFRMATSVGGVLTGRGADYLILDDPMKPDEAISDTSRNSVNSWYDNTLYSRLDDKQAGCIILIMQRLHLDDLVAHVLRQEHWEVVSLPAVAEVNEVHEFETIYGRQTARRAAGSALHPERESLETLRNLELTLGQYNFAGQYQQSPVPLGGGMVKTAWLKYYEDQECPGEFETILQSWDTASKVTELSDFSVCTTWGIKDKKVYLLAVLRRRLSYRDLKAAAWEQFKSRKPSHVLIEDKSSGTQLIQELIADGLSCVKGIKPLKDKKMRLHAQTGTIENGMLFLPARAAWLADYVHELTSFPFSNFDDQVDSTSQALEWIATHGFEPGILAYVRMEAQRVAGIRPAG